MKCKPLLLSYLEVSGGGGGGFKFKVKTNFFCPNKESKDSLNPKVRLCLYKREK